MPVRAVLFDVGDTLVEHFADRDRTNELVRGALRREFGERHWYEPFLRAEIAPRHHAQHDVPETALRQETLRWYADWFRNAQVGSDDIDMDRLRLAVTVPLDLVSTPVPGAFTAVRWCKTNDLKVVLVTNTLSRGDEEVWEDWRRFGLADAIDAVVSSHSIGWQKPHRRIFERALELGGVSATDAVMVGDQLDADVRGAAQLGMRTILRRTPGDQRAIDVTPDAVIDDLTELPGVLTAWLGVPTAHRSTIGG